LKITDSNDKTDNTGTYEHALILTVFSWAAQRLTSKVLNNYYILSEKW
jgi:hypothetical protein